MSDVDVIGDAGRLRAFVAVAASGGFSRAAEVLGVTQPTVSSLIAGLERRTGARLLVRSRAGARLTAAGEALLPHAERMLAAAEEARRAVDAAAAGGRRHLAVAGGEALVTHLLPPALARLRARVPRLSLTLTAAEPAAARDALRTGRVTCLLVAAATAPDDLSLTPVGDDRLVLVGAPGTPAATTPLAEVLAGSPLVAREAGRADRGETDALLRRLGVVPREVTVVAGLEAAKRAVEAGLGVAMLPGVAVRGELAAGRLREIPTTEALPALRYAVAVRRGADPDPLVDALVRSLRRAGAAAV